VLAKSELVRFVLGPNNMIYPDLENKLPGRGMWVKAERSAILKQKKVTILRAANQNADMCGKFS